MNFVELQNFEFKGLNNIVDNFNMDVNEDLEQSISTFNYNFEGHTNIHDQNNLVNVPSHPDHFQSSYNTSPELHLLSSSDTSSPNSAENIKPLTSTARGRPRKYFKEDERRFAAKQRHSKDRKKRKQKEENEKFQQNRILEMNENLKIKYSKITKTNNLLLKNYLQIYSTFPDSNLIWNEPDGLSFFNVQLKKSEINYLAKIDALKKQKSLNPSKKCREKKKLDQEKADRNSNILVNLNNLLQRWINKISLKNEDLKNSFNVPLIQANLGSSKNYSQNHPEMYHQNISNLLPPQNNVHSNIGEKHGYYTSGFHQSKISNFTNVSNMPQQCYSYPNPNYAQTKYCHMPCEYDQNQPALQYSDYPMQVVPGQVSKQIIRKKNYEKSMN